MQISEVTIGKIATITMGTSPKGETYNNEGIGIPLLNGPTEFGSIYPTCMLFTTDSKRDCKKDDLIFCVRGSTTGRMNWADKQYSLGRGVCSIRGATPMNTKYIRYCIELKLGALLKLSGGATFPNLTGNDLSTFPIPYLPHRHKITSIPQLKEVREEIVKNLKTGLIRQYYGFDVAFNEDFATKMINDPTGDSLDAFLCAIQAGWAYEHREHGYGIPEGFELERRIINPEEYERIKI